MTDRELLELAAKVAKYEVNWGLNAAYVVTRNVRGVHGLVQVTLWNPLTDDGDAFRLGVDSGVRFLYHSELGRGLAWDSGGREYGVNVEACGGDPRAAARRAVVLAAVGSLAFSGRKATGERQ